MNGGIRSCLIIVDVINICSLYCPHCYHHFPFSYLILMWFARFIGFLRGIQSFSVCVRAYVCLTVLSALSYSSLIQVCWPDIKKMKSNYRSSVITHTVTSILTLYWHYTGYDNMSINIFLLSQIFTKLSIYWNDYDAWFFFLLFCLDILERLYIYIYICQNKKRKGKNGRMLH